MLFWKDGMVTMHDVLDAQWQMDSAKDGNVYTLYGYSSVTNYSMVFSYIVQNRT